MNEKINYKLKDIVEISLLHDLLDRLNEVYAFPLATINNKGKLLVAVEWQDMCIKFHRQNRQFTIDEKSKFSFITKKI